MTINQLKIMRSMVLDLFSTFQKIIKPFLLDDLMRENIADCKLGISAHFDSAICSAIITQKREEEIHFSNLSN